jgi:hypothetical protein
MECLNSKKVVLIKSGTAWENTVAGDSDGYLGNSVRLKPKQASGN